MSGQSEKYLDTTLFYLYLIFIVTSTVSIAASQTALGLSLIVFAAVASLKRYNPFPSALKWFYVFVGLYVLWLFLSALVNRTPLASTLIMKEEWLFCAVPIGVYLLKSNGKRNRLITAFAVAVLLVSIYGLDLRQLLRNSFGLSPGFRRSWYQFTGTASAPFVPDGIDARHHCDPAHLRTRTDCRAGTGADHCRLRAGKAILQVFRGRHSGDYNYRSDSGPGAVSTKAPGHLSGRTPPRLYAKILFSASDRAISRRPIPQNSDPTSRRSANTPTRITIY